MDKENAEGEAAPPWWEIPEDVAYWYSLGDTITLDGGIKILITEWGDMIKSVAGNTRRFRGVLQS